MTADLKKAPWYESLLKYNAWIVAALYALGFVVANAHYGRYAPVQTALLPGRYLAAGLLFAVFTAIPLGAFVVGNLTGRTLWRDEGEWPFVVPKLRIWIREHGMGEGAEPVRRMLFGIFRFALVAFSLWLSWEAAESLASVAVVGGAAPHAMTYVGAVLVLTIIYSGLHIATSPEQERAASRILGPSAAPAREARPEERTTLRTALGAGLAALVLPGLAITFGQWVYPSINPAFGGAASRLAVIAVSRGAADTLSSPLGFRGDTVAVVEQESSFVTYMGCLKAPTTRDGAGTHGPGVSVYVRALPTGKVNELAQLGVFVSVQEYADSLQARGCGYMPRTDTTMSADRTPEGAGAADTARPSPAGSGTHHAGSAGG